MQPAWIHHVGLPVRDLDVSVAWYRKALGLTHEAAAGVPGRVAFMLAPTGEPSVPRISRWMVVKDKKKFVDQLGEIATPDLRRVIVTHGKMIDDRAAETIKTVASALS